MLYLVATPIGNLEDMSFRAIRILKEVSLIAAEDTRHSGKLLKHFEISTPLISYHDYSDENKIRQIIDRLSTEDVALISDAGTPGLSDPGYRLVQAAIKANILITPIPGPAAAIAGLVASGMPTDRFIFLGFLPRQLVKRQSALQGVALLTCTLIVYESPHRLLALLDDIMTVLGDRPVVVCREISKMYEEFWRGNAGEAAKHFSLEPVRGEVTLIIGGASEDDQIIWDDTALVNALEEAIASGLSKKDAAAHVSAMSGQKKREVYQLSLTL
ncbi:MAG: 16S rRNA (cytidine1402-2'-O)-methyltransferase [Cellvibrionaceae bacterium]|jgi:16S rRNA (cytidine1402-2'-O)-methyltransferase